MVYSTCLLIKARLESDKTRTAERAALQIQVYMIKKLRKKFFFVGFSRSIFR